MLRRLYEFGFRAAARPSAVWWLALVSFLESSVLPLPPDVLLVPMMLARPRRAVWLALVCTAASVAGGWLGYAIGWFLFEQVGAQILALYHYEAQFAAFQDTFQRWGVWIILLKGVTPIPYKLVTIAAGVAKLDLVRFTLASIVARGGRFVIMGLLTRRYGAPIQAIIDRYLPWVAAGLAAVAAAGVVAAGRL